jgi:predicted acylesterase/phospholipase RssA
MKRAIALSGGGPVVGIEIGALKAFEQKNIDFDVYSCACVGSWVGCLYNSLKPDTDRLGDVEKFFKDEIFISDDVYQSFPINYKVFRRDYLSDSQKLMEKIFDVNTYQQLFLPNKLWEYAWKFVTNPPKTTDEYCYYISEGMALNPFIRLSTELQYNVNKSGVAGLISSGAFVNKFINFDNLFKSDKIVYLNAYNLSQKQMEIFVNRNGEPKYSPMSADALMAGSSVLHYTENRTIAGKKDEYCEGAVINTVELDHLLDDHSDLDEIWVIKIADYKQITPPKNLIEAELLGVMLPFDTISDDDIVLFSQRLQEYNRKNSKNIKLVNVLMKYGTLNYHWNHSNLNQGIQVGYNGTLNAINTFINNGGNIGTFSDVEIIS